MAKQRKPKSRNPKLEFDLLKMYFRDPYKIDLEGADGSITVYQPSIGDIVEYGEEAFYANLNIFIGNTTSYRLPLWEAGIDWNELSDFNLFIQLYQQVQPEFSALIFKDIDITKFELYQRQLEDEAFFVLYDEENKIEINEEVYFHISQYLRTMFQNFPKEEIARDQFLKDILLEEDRRKVHNAKYKKEHGMEVNNSIQTLISGCVNHPGFKYKTSELKEIGIYEFMDSVGRLQIYESTRAMLGGAYGGFADMSKVDNELFNFMRAIET